MKKWIRILLRTIIVLFVLGNLMLALHAYKLTHFYDVAEIDIIPENEKTSWDRAKDILFGLNTVKKPSSHKADSSFEKIILETADKLKLEALYLTTDSAVKGTVVLFHGHHSNRLGVLGESEMFRKMGYNTLLPDFRAHGNSEGNTCTIGYEEAEDVKLAYDYIKNKGEKNIILWGISMGAAAITKAVNDYQLQPKKIILEMPYGSLQDAVEGKLSTMHLPKQPLASLLTFWGGAEHGFWAFNMKPTEYVKKINIPVLMQWGKNDPRVTKKEIDEIYNNILSAKKLVIYDNCGHESLYTKENDKWLKEVNDFLQQ